MYCVMDRLIFGKETYQRVFTRKEKFSSKSGNEKISDRDYRHARRVLLNMFNIKNLGHIKICIT